MKHTFLALILAAGPALAAIDPALMALAPSDAKALAGIQVDQSRSSVLGQFLLSQLGPQSGLDTFIAATGFDLVIPDDLPTSRLPSVEELRLLTQVIDPNNTRLREVPEPE